MISLEDLFDNELIEEIKQDVLDECHRYGEALKIEIPVPLGPL